MRLAVLTSGRQDWGILRSTCRLLQEDAFFELQLLVGGMHLSEKFGKTQNIIHEDGFTPAALLPWVDDAGEWSATRQASEAVKALGECLPKLGSQALMLVGDRFETAAAALAATMVRVPVVHVHGGEETAGAIDNGLRHSVSKLSHLHLVSSTEHAARLHALGEDPQTVHVVGAPGLDNLHRTDLATRDELEAWLGISLTRPVVLVTLHPTTLASQPLAEAQTLCEAMNCLPSTYIITLPNVDPGFQPLAEMLKSAGKQPGRAVVQALGERRYWGLMKLADAMLGNSSSALIEAPALSLGAVNIGDRQQGRQRGANVIDVQPRADEIVAAMQRILQPDFRHWLRQQPQPFGDGRSAPRIVSILRGWTPPQPPRKRLISIPTTGET